MTSHTNVLPYDAGLNNDQIMALDPLHFDSTLPQLWEMNARADVNGLAELLRDLIPASDHLAEFSPFECLAAMRDLGLLLGSIRRYGPEPVEVVPEVEPILLELGARTDMVPRDTIHHYITWNPTGMRERLYTGERTESVLLSATRMSLPRLTAAVERCRRLVALSPFDSDFAAPGNELAEILERMEDTIDIVSAKVSPEFFARTMRPYFEDVRVGEVTYMGPAAAHAPLWLVDLALWASDHGDAIYETLWRDSARHGLPPWRELYEIWAKSPSVVTRVLSAPAFASRGTDASDATLPSALRESAEALRRALRALTVFRGRHLVLARKVYDDSISLYAYGSGGGNPDLLGQIVQLTRENASLVRTSLESVLQSRS